MRMPPYMRDSDALPLSITHRQYDALIKLLDISAAGKGKVRSEGPTTRRIRAMLKRREMPRKK
jgi:hypothetical protein